VKKIFALSAILAVAIAGCLPVNAADLAVKASPAAPLDPWTGAYIGINGGYGFDLGQGVAIGQVATAAQINAAPQGAVGGIQAGIGTRFLSYGYAGFEADIDAANLTGTAGDPAILTGTSKNTWLMSARARLGIIPTNHVMFYGTVGYGWGGGEFSLTDIRGGTASINPTMSGPVWGAGVEIQLISNWLARAEYLQYDFGTATVSTVGAGAASFTLKDRVDVVRAGLSYKF
jgi:outer membrane immunogenic protein